jgi:D-aminopeptidase
MIGYHAPAASDANPLAHTMNLGVTIKLNGVYASEFLLHAYAAALKNVPVVFISGDAGLCAHVQSFNPPLASAPSKRRRWLHHQHPPRARRQRHSGGRPTSAERRRNPLPPPPAGALPRRNHLPS